MNIYQKIIEVRKSIDAFTKDTKGFGYTYVSGAQVLKKIKDKMDELQIVLEPHVVNQHHETFDYTNAKGEAKTDFVVFGDMEYHWINAEEPQDRIAVKWQLFGQQDDISKAFGSGLTYSERYFLLKYFGVPTDEDDPDARQTNNRGRGQSKGISSKQIGFIKVNVGKLAQLRNVKDEEVYKALGVTDITKLSASQASQVIEKLNKWMEQANENN